MKSDTVLDFMNFDIHSILRGQELSRKTTFQTNLYSDDFTDYEYELRNKESGIFDRLQLRIFSNEKTLSPNTSSNLTLFSTEKTPAHSIMEMCNVLKDKFGADLAGRNELDEFDLDDIVAGGFWNGRAWAFNMNNERHSGAEGEEYLYILMIGVDDIHGFEININGFSKLLGYVESKILN